MEKEARLRSFHYESEVRVETENGGGPSRTRPLPDVGGGKTDWSGVRWGNGALKR